MVGSLTETSTSVTAFDSDEARSRSAISNVSDVAAYTPNLEIRTASSTTATLLHPRRRPQQLHGQRRERRRRLRRRRAAQSARRSSSDSSTTSTASKSRRDRRARARAATRRPVRFGCITKKPKGEYDAYSQHGLRQLRSRSTSKAPSKSRSWKTMLGIRTAFKMLTRDGIMNNRCGGKSPRGSLGGWVPSAARSPNPDRAEASSPSAPNLERPPERSPTPGRRGRACASFRRSTTWNGTSWATSIGRISSRPSASTSAPSGNLGGVDGDSYRAPKKSQNEAQRIIDPAARRFRPSASAGSPPIPPACRAEAERIRQLAVSTLALNLAGQTPRSEAVRRRFQHAGLRTP